MPLSPIDKADRNSRNRGMLMQIGAIALLILAGFSASGIPHDTTDLTRAIVWALLVLAWMLMLATGGGLMINRQVRSLMNDEVSADNRRRALETGFWTAMAMALGLYFASLAWPLGLRDSLAMLTEIALAAALLRYARLELR
jgi:protein-S-isoprenylcysteine O-methyltransferase Ste14